MSDEKKKRRKKRSPKELIKAKQRELEKLKDRVRRQEIERAIEAGKLSDEKEKEFKALKRKVAVMRKAASIFEDAGSEDAAEEANKLAVRFSKAMSVIVDEADEDSDDSDEEYEYEEDSDEGDDDEYEEEEEEEEEDDDED